MQKIYALLLFTLLAGCTRSFVNPAQPGTAAWIPTEQALPQLPTFAASDTASVFATAAAGSAGQVPIISPFEPVTGRREEVTRSPQVKPGPPGESPRRVTRLGLMKRLVRQNLPRPGPRADPDLPGKPNGLAIASLAIALTGLLGLGLVLAGPLSASFLLLLPLLGGLGLVLGIVAGKKIRRSNGQQSGAGLALAGLIIGIAEVGIFLLFITLALLFFAAINGG